MRHTPEIVQKIELYTKNFYFPRKVRQKLHRLITQMVQKEKEIERLREQYFYVRDRICLSCTLLFWVIVIEGSRHSQMGQKVRFAPSTNSWGGKLHDDVSDLIHMLCTEQWVKKN